ncbi:MAG: hybrid sensor histidine kinase/response regulator, partial [Rhizobiaceae bacterium]|nr:hybrid sensor histidine kinase/response regulator [Rhizobiaceae bacterium]
LSDANIMLERRVAERTGELTALNKRLAKATKIADQANLDKTRFLAAAGHDILQPLNAARLYSSTLIERLDNERNREFAQSVNQSLDSVEDILGAVLAISHLDSSHDEVKLSASSLNRIFEQLKIEFRPIAEKENVELIFVNTSAVVKTDASLLKRLLQNLISNALKYTNEGKVLVGCRRKGDEICIEVIDTGIGIAAKDQPLIFKEFKRLKTSINKVPGLGLGLSIVERISRRLGHKVEVISEPNKGTRFKVSVKRAKGAVTELYQTRRIGTTTSNITPGTKVLCVDNDADVLSGLSSLLQQWDCKVTMATSSSEAMALIESQKLQPDIILMDYHLNEENGIDAIIKLREKLGSNLAAVLVTAERSNAVKHEAERLGLTFINKPVKPAALRSILASARNLTEAAE